mgnify:CR=1 FL=1
MPTPASARIELFERPNLAEGKSPPSWAVGDQPPLLFWYFVNQYWEQWVAKAFGDELAIAGIDIGWGETRLTLEKARDVLDNLQKALTNPSDSFIVRVNNLVLEKAEATWLVAVLIAALPLMELERKARQGQQRSEA